MPLTSVTLSEWWSWVLTVVIQLFSHKWSSCLSWIIFCIVHLLIWWWNTKLDQNLLHWPNTGCLLLWYFLNQKGFAVWCSQGSILGLCYLRYLLVTWKTSSLNISSTPTSTLMTFSHISAGIQWIYLLPLNVLLIVTSVERRLHLKCLKLNRAKTELIFLSHRNQISKLSLTSIKLGGVDSQRSNSTRDLGVIIDENLSMSDHISNVVCSSFYQIRQLSASLTTEALMILDSCTCAD